MHLHLINGRIQACELQAENEPGDVNERQNSGWYKGQIFGKNFDQVFLQTQKVLDPHQYHFAVFLISRS